jgi:hypothetical protein
MQFLNLASKIDTFLHESQHSGLSYEHNRGERVGSK